VEKMCLILFAYKYHPKYHLILLANRDEFYQRPSLPLDYWLDAPTILAGRDLKGNGTWLGLTRSGRIAAVTNYRDPLNLRSDAPSRGLLIRNYLSGNQSPQDYVNALCGKRNFYNGFNLLIGDQAQLYYYSNYHPAITKITPGIHGLSNHLLNTAWPKVTTGKKYLKHLLDQSDQITIEDYFKLLTDRTIFCDQQLPNTGVGLAWERILSPLFITSPDYGTRCSSIILIKPSGTIQFYERTYDPNSHPSVEPLTKEFFIKPER
jgi:uncharacterized protein with NRDE domain